MKVVVYTAEWCGPCKVFKNILNKYGVEYTSVNIDEDPNEASQLGIRGVPTTIVYDGEEEVNRFVGSSKDIVGKIKELLDE